MTRPGTPPQGTPWVLIGHRLPHAHLPDFWEFPGGKVEVGETSADCARREVWEETGVRVQVVGLLGTQEHEYPDRSVRIDFHLCRYIAGVPQPLACQAVRWVQPDRLDLYPFPNANLDILERLKSGGWFPSRTAEAPGQLDINHDGPGP